MAKAAAKHPAKKIAKKAATKVAKKAAKKVAAKAAKKAPAKHAAGHDLRRAYEHLHRIGVLHRDLNRETLSQVEVLSRLAHAALRSGDSRNAADLLRACEHLAFGSLALDSADVNAGDDLATAARQEYEHLSSAATERWAERDSTDSREIAATYNLMRRSARDAFKADAFHRALEFARAAEALSHVRVTTQGRLPATKQAKRSLRAPR